MKAIPSVNKYLSRKWEEKMQIEHRQRLNNSTARLDNKPPPIFRHLEYKPKTMQLIEGKCLFSS